MVPYFGSAEPGVGGAQRQAPADRGHDPQACTANWASRPSPCWANRRREEIPAEVPVECFPLKEMYQRGWFSDFKGTWQQAMEQAEELVTKFFCFGVEPDALPAMNRQMKPTKAAGKEDKYALLAWRTRVLCRAGSKDSGNHFRPEGGHPGVPAAAREPEHPQDRSTFGRRPARKPRELR